MDDLERRLRTTNLNLLPILRAVLKYKNLTRAAEALNITQSGVSNSLKQLRAHFGDDLLSRDGRSLRLTEKSKQLIEPLERALRSVGEVLSNPRFEPGSSRQQFRVATADYVAAITAPEMAAMLRREAPSITVRLMTARGRSAMDLRAGDIDMIISPLQIAQAAIYDSPVVAREFALEPLYREPFLCLAHADDRDFARGLTREEYLARPHASFHLDVTAHASLEHGYLIEQGISQFNRIQTSDFRILPLIAARSDCIVLVPQSVARMALRAMPLIAAPPPLPIPDLELVMIWLRARSEEAELAWLRDRLKKCIALSVAGEPPATLTGRDGSDKKFPFPQAGEGLKKSRRPAAHRKPAKTARKKGKSR
ncbi:MAG: LysR family transcriptional regulator [Alphaproteobacteria bacterium]|nr:LysR family transcriptional regulator [Alphaproteobacteria bacterium]